MKWTISFHDRDGKVLSMVVFTGTLAEALTHAAMTLPPDTMNVTVFMAV
jgi:hypothetical protein